MTKLRFDNVWYASRKKAFSISKTIVYEEKGGELTINGENETFTYKSGDFALNNCKITAITTKRQRFSIIGYLRYSGLSVIYFGLAKNPLYGVVGLSIGLVLALLVWLSSRWIVIQYQVPGEDRNELAWFFDGHFFGWGGFLGGNRKMHQEIKEFLGVD